MWTSYSSGCIIFFDFFWFHSETSDNTKRSLYWQHFKKNVHLPESLGGFFLFLFFDRKRIAMAHIFSCILLMKTNLKQTQPPKCMELVPFTWQTLLVVLGLRDQCLGCLREEASYRSCIRNNLEENFHLWFAPHDQYPFCHLQERDTNVLITKPACVEHND